LYGFVFKHVLKVTKHNRNWIKCERGGRRKISFVAQCFVFRTAIRQPEKWFAGKVQVTFWCCTCGFLLQPTVI